MRRTILLMVTMALTLLVASGVALAVTRIGTDGPDTLRGTRGSDQLLGMGGSDRINGRPGKDVISGGPGGDTLIDGPIREGAVDTLAGGAGNDELVTWNRPVARDVVSCGTGRDFAFVDRKDIVSDDCERILIISGVVIVD
jgi:Ca2+-binding RTX toxin-like protein